MSSVFVLIFILNTGRRHNLKWKKLPDDLLRSTWKMDRSLCSTWEGNVIPSCPRSTSLRSSKSPCSGSWNPPPERGKNVFCRSESTYSFGNTILTITDATIELVLGVSCPACVIPWAPTLVVSVGPNQESSGMVSVWALRTCFYHFIFYFHSPTLYRGIQMYHLHKHGVSLLITC